MAFSGTDSSLLESFQNELTSFQTNASSLDSLNATRRLIKQLEAIEERNHDLELEENAEDDPTVNKVITQWKHTVVQTQKRTNTQVTRLLRYLDNNIYSFNIVDELRGSDEKGPSIFKLNLILFSCNNQKLINQIIYDHLEKYTNENEDYSYLSKLIEKRFGILSENSTDKQIDNDDLFTERIDFLNHMFTCFKDAKNINTSCPQLIICWSKVFDWLRAESLNELLVNLHVFIFVRIFIKNGIDEAVKYYDANKDEFGLDSLNYSTEDIELLIKLYDTKNSGYKKQSDKILKLLEGSITWLFKHLTILYCKFNHLKSFKLKKNDINESPDSRLFSILMASMMSLPKIHKFVKQFNIKKKLSTSNDELVIELPAYIKDTHPIFICPVTKEETTAENPPMKLNCNHIISKESIKKLIESKKRESFIRGGNISLMQNNSRSNGSTAMADGSDIGYTDDYESDQLYDVEEDDQEDIVLDMEDEAMASVRYIYAPEIIYLEPGTIQAPRNMDDDAELARQSVFYRRERRRMRSGMNLDTRAERQRRRRLRQRELIRRREEEEERELLNIRSIRTNESMLESSRLRYRSTVARFGGDADDEQDEDEDLANLEVSEDDDFDTDFDFGENEVDKFQGGHSGDNMDTNNGESGADYLTTPGYMNSDGVPSGLLPSQGRNPIAANGLDYELSVNLKVSFKCPYCPTTCSGMHCQKVSFQRC